MRRFFLAFLAIGLAVSALAQAPANYYNSANGLTGNALKVALHNIIKGHTTISYGDIWYAFYATDHREDDVTKVWDMYSDIPGGTPPYIYTLGNKQCGNYSGEGDCYNKEHSWPSSWFNDQGTPRTDLHHIFATDGYVNNRRSSYPYGEVRSATWTSKNGSKLGTCKTPGYSGTVFEPIDEYKGDFARAYFYMTVRYYGEDTNWGSSDMTNKSNIEPWAMTMLLRWHQSDPVSQKEIDRNNVIYSDYQHNRNPFIDHPEYARMIWDPTWSTDEWDAPDPIRIDRVVVYDLTGRKLFELNDINDVDFNLYLKNRLQQGCYIVQRISGNRAIEHKKILVN